jgi:hypothetical protein
LRWYQVTPTRRFLLDPRHPEWQADTDFSERLPSGRGSRQTRSIASRNLEMLVQIPQPKRPDDSPEPPPRKCLRRRAASTDGRAESFLASSALGDQPEIPRPRRGSTFKCDELSGPQARPVGRQNRLSRRTLAIGPAFVGSVSAARWSAVLGDEPLQPMAAQ